jgi:hypothetical protein
MELGLPTPVSHPISQGMRLLSSAANPHQKYICKYRKIGKIWRNQFLKIRESVPQTHFWQQRVCQMQNFTFSLILQTQNLCLKSS